MDTTDPNILFDADGNCNHCTEYFHLEKRVLNQKTQRIINQIKQHGQDKPYDCLLGIGGGCDCSYVAYLAFKYGLRVFLFHMDNGWNTREAEYNIKALTEKTGFPLFRYKIDQEEFNDVVLSFMKASVIDIEVATDHAATALLFYVAQTKKLKYVLTGSNVVTETIMPRAWGYRKNDLPNLKAIHKRFGKTNLETYPTINLLKLAYYQTVKRIHMVPLLNYICYNREQAKRTLAQFCGWQDYGLKHYENIWTRFYQRYILPTKFHVDKRRAHYSTLICSRQMTRDQALKELEKPLYHTGELSREKTYVLNHLGLTLEQFNSLMKTPIRKHEDYPTDKKLYLLLKTARNSQNTAMRIAVKLLRKMKNTGKHRKFTSWWRHFRRHHWLKE